MEKLNYLPQNQSLMSKCLGTADLVGRSQRCSYRFYNTWIVQCNHKVLIRKNIMGSERKVEGDRDRDIEQQRHKERQRHRQ